MISCSPTMDYRDHHAPIISANVQISTIDIQGNESRSYSITENQEIEDFITDIHDSKVNGPWSGTKWDKIVLYYEDGGEKVSSTNGKVFGQGSSGIFY